jgi:hypothetical protein
MFSELKALLELLGAKLKPLLDLLPPKFWLIVIVFVALVAYWKNLRTFAGDLVEFFRKDPAPEDTRFRERFIAATSSHIEMLTQLSMWDPTRFIDLEGVYYPGPRRSHGSWPDSLRSILSTGASSPHRF